MSDFGVRVNFVKIDRQRRKVYRGALVSTRKDRSAAAAASGATSGRDPAPIVDLGPVLEAAADPATTTLVAVRRVRKAYEQVADQLRSLIIGGHLAVGDRLPNETELAKEFGVSRATVREALRTLAAQRLILTAKGAGGGTYVANPGLDFISEFLQANINLLTETHHITLLELLEAREHLEVFAAKLAAERRTKTELLRLRDSVPSVQEAMGKQERFGFNINFHSIMMEISGNGLLYLSALPVFSVLQTNLARGELTEKWHKDVSRQHAHIADAIEAGDGNAASDLMKSHLAFIRPSYERIWRHAVQPERLRPRRSQRASTTGGSTETPPKTSARSSSAIRSSS
jgi:DNA-binding FadR family transcriptional regulator